MQCIYGLKVFLVNNFELWCGNFSGRVNALENGNGDIGMGKWAGKMNWENGLGKWTWEN